MVVGRKKIGFRLNLFYVAVFLFVALLVVSAVIYFQYNTKENSVSGNVVKTTEDGASITKTNSLNQLKYNSPELSKYNINFNSPDVKKLKPAIQSQLKSLSSERQQQVNLELKQTQEGIKKSGALWKADFTSKSLLTDEQKKKLLGLKGVPDKTKLINFAGRPKSDSGGTVLPDNFDWRNVGGKNYITSIKDQGNCGSCWAFGAVATFEGNINAYYNNETIDYDLSEQDLVSCFLPGSCGPGANQYEIEKIFSDYAKNTGITTESCFPYSATDSSCNKCSNWNLDSVKDSDYYAISLTNDLQENIRLIKEAVVNYGPVEVGFYVYADFPDYSGGIYQHTTENFLGGHAVSIVGFGKYDGRDYYIVKNSWGLNWGENGYFRIFADDSIISNWFAFAVKVPNPTKPKTIVCTDNDKDGYCYWGLSMTKPTNCPASCSVNSAKDCDDSNSAIYQNCGKSNEQTGTLNISSTPSGADVYVKDLISGNWNYRGQTPLVTNLGAGMREIKLRYDSYLDLDFSTTISKTTLESITKILTRDPSIKVGWPRLLGHYNSGSSPQIADIDNDGKKEIIQSAGDWQNSLYVFDENGNNKEGWPVSFSTLGIFKNYDSYSDVTPLVVDINQDNKLEIITIVFKRDNKYFLHALDYNGNIIPGWDINLSDLVSAPFKDVDVNFDRIVLTADDIDNDGNKEVIFAFGYYIFVISEKGTLKQGWPQKTICTAIGGVAVGDLDGDGIKELVYSCSYPTENSSIYIFKPNGAIVSGWPKQYPPASPTEQISIGDVDGDGIKEIIFKYQDFSTAEKYDSVIDVLDSKSGKSKPGWPKSSNIFRHFSISDLNKDGFAEIIAASDEGLHVFRYDGTKLSGWPLSFSSVSYIITDDVNGDSYPEIIVGIVGAYRVDESLIYAFDRTGKLVSDWPKRIGGSLMYSSPALDDIDNDKKIELIIPAYPSDSKPKKLYVFNLNKSYNPSPKDWSMFMYDLGHTGCYDCDKPTIKCSDIDKGRDYTLFGTTKGNEIGTKKLINKSDYCIGSDRLVEFFCDGPNSANNYEYVNNEIINCTKNYGKGYGCKNGVCVAICADTDAGKCTGMYPAPNNKYNCSAGDNPFEKGKITKLGSVLNGGIDSCINGLLTEYYCDANNNPAVMKSFNCANLNTATKKYSCANGACVTTK